MSYKFYQERPERLTGEFLDSESDRILGKIDEAERNESSDRWISLYSEWNALLGYAAGERSRINYRFSQKMDDPEREEEDRYAREVLAPIMRSAEHRFVGALVGSRHAGAVARHYGENLLPLYRISIETLAPVNNDLRIEEGRLARDYSKMVAMAEVELNGVRMTIRKAASMGDTDDPAMRYASYEAVKNWVLDHRDRLAEIFDRLVKIRHQMALNVGYENFVRLGYQGRERTDYGPAEAAAFRESVRRYAVPLRTAILERQRKRLGTPTLKPWDVGYDPDLLIPNGVVPVETQLDRAQELFTTLSERLGDHFARMRKDGLIDLENRPAKRPGAFCTYMADEGHPAILCNSTGSSDDVRTLIHEMGHAFQKWESNHIETLELHSPPTDASEIHSMGMEYLALPYITAFFSEENAERFRSERWQSAIIGMCYRALVDEFQHWVYEHPEATPGERDEAWKDLSRIYEPGVDYEGVEKYDGLKWYQQSHIFVSPFYYIDYAIAEIGAMQLALIDAEDHERAMETYMKLCRIGGTKSVLDIVDHAGLRSPFDPDVMRDLMTYAASRLGIVENASV